MQAYLEDVHLKMGKHAVAKVKETRTSLETMIAAKDKKCINVKDNLDQKRDVNIADPAFVKEMLGISKKPESAEFIDNI